LRYPALSEARKRDLRYGALVLALVLLGAGVIFLSHRNDQPNATPSVSTPASTVPSGRGASTAPGGRRAVTGSAAAQAAASPDDEGDGITVVNNLRRDEAVGLIADARRQALAGQYDLAEASLQRAEKAAPKLPEITQARADIARLQTPEGQLDLQLQRARLAIDHDDPAAAEAALAEAARLKPNAPQIAELRAAVRAEHDKKARREARIGQALTRMREAVARRDFGAADSALNEAERIDLQDPAIRRARGELARARGAQQNISD
jgi:hypothetical protein